MVRALALGLLSSCCVAAVASAADLRTTKSPVMSAAPAWSWSGSYIGIHGGWGFGDADQTYRPGSAFAPPTGGAFGTDLDGGVIGFHTGRNWQVGNWVFGLEGGNSWTGISGKDTNIFAVAPNTSYETKIEQVSTFTPRLGVAFDNWLLYGKAGIAYGRAETTVMNAAGVRFREATDHLGWTVGLGVEYALTPNWIFGVEYNHVNLGDERYAGFASNNGTTDLTNDLAYSTVLARLSYKSSGGGNPIVGWLFGPETPGGMWSGLYVGVHGGYGWGTAELKIPAVPGSAVFPGGGKFDIEPDGGMLGLHVGHMSQRGNWVFGNEFAVSWTGLKGSDPIPPGALVAPTTAVAGTVELDWLATSTFRLGYAFGPWLLYAKGGGAMGEVEHTGRTTRGGAVFAFSESNAHIGWTAGAGIEYAMGNWIAGVEYNYYDLGTERYGGNTVPANAVTFADYKADLTFSSVLARLSYRFGDPAPAVMTKY